MGSVDLAWRQLQAGQSENPKREGEHQREEEPRVAFPAPSGSSPPMPLLLAREVEGLTNIRYSG